MASSVFSINKSIYLEERSKRKAGDKLSAEWNDHVALPYFFPERQNSLRQFLFPFLNGMIEKKKKTLRQLGCFSM